MSDIEEIENPECFILKFLNEKENDLKNQFQKSFDKKKENI